MRIGIFRAITICSRANEKPRSLLREIFFAYGRKHDTKSPISRDMNSLRDDSLSMAFSILLFRGKIVNWNLVLSINNILPVTGCKVCMLRKAAVLFARFRHRIIFMYNSYIFSFSTFRFNVILLFRTYATLVQNKISATFSVNRIIRLN